MHVLSVYTNLSVNEAFHQKTHRERRHDKMLPSRITRALTKQRLCERLRLRHGALALCTRIREELLVKLALARSH
jgi:hypothetical protein